MGTHPLNLALRFVLEIAALASLAGFGWSYVDGPAQWPAAVGLPVTFMILWGVFAVPEDPSRSGSAPVPVSGLLRLVLELALFALAGVALLWAGYPRLSLGFGLLVIGHYAISWDRIAWLLARKFGAPDDPAA